MVHIIGYHSGEPRLLIPEEIDEEELKGQTTPEVLENLLELIGGFDGWGKLNDDCRRHVANHLNIEALTSLGACSLQDRQLVDDTRIHVVSVEIHDCYDELSGFQRSKFGDNEVLVNIRFHTESSREHHVLFSQQGDDTHVIIAQKRKQFVMFPISEEVRATLKSTNHITEAVKFAEKWMKRGRFELSKLVVNLKEYPFEGSLIEYLPKCSELQLKTNDNAVFTWWLRRVPARVQKLSVMRYYKDQRSHGQVGRDVVKFTAVSMRYEAYDFQVSVFLDHWASGYIPHNFEILKMITRGHRQNAPLVGPTVVAWSSAEFRNEKGVEELLGMFKNKTLYYKRFHYQVYSLCNPYDSVSVCLSGYEVYIIRTGRKGYDKDGRPQKEYFIPADIKWCLEGDSYYR